MSRKPKHWRVILALLVAAILGGIAFVAIALGATRAADNKFGDQHSKTAVALLELHKTRFGSYPGALSDLKFI